MHRRDYAERQRRIRDTSAEATPDFAGQARPIHADRSSIGVRIPRKSQVVLRVALFESARCFILMHGLAQRHRRQKSYIRSNVPLNRYALCSEHTIMSSLHETIIRSELFSLKGLAFSIVLLFASVSPPLTACTISCKTLWVLRYIPSVIKVY